LAIVEHRKRRHRRNYENNFFNFRKQSDVLRKDVIPKEVLQNDVLRTDVLRNDVFRSDVFRKDQKHFVEKRESSEDIQVTSRLQKWCGIFKNDILKSDISRQDSLLDRNEFDRKVKEFRIAISLLLFFFTKLI
jgi:hypothetical protein